MWVPPFAVHSSKAYGETDIRVLSLPVTLTGQLPAEPSVFVASALLREAFLALMSEGEPLESPRARLLIDVVLAELARAAQEPLRLPEPSDRRLKAVTDLLHMDPASPATLAELGHRTGASERTLSRLFGSELSMSFHQWRTLLRTQRALIELSDGASVGLVEPRQLHRRLHRARRSDTRELSLVGSVLPQLPWVRGWRGSRSSWRNIGGSPMVRDSTVGG
jgi:hypothetical protein